MTPGVGYAPPEGDKGDSGPAYILLIRPGALGDTILSLPLLESVREKNPDAGIVFAGTASYRSLCPQWATFEAVDSAKWSWLFDDNPPARRAQFWTAYVALRNPGAVIRNLTAAGVKNIFHCSSSPEPGIHLVESIHGNLNLDIPARKPVLLIDPAVKRVNRIWLHPGSGGKRKCLPLDFWVNLIERLRGSVKARLAVTLGEADDFVTADASWERLISLPDLDLFHNQPLETLRAKLHDSMIFMGNDSGISHLAAALGVPCVLFYVTTDPKQWSPWVSEDDLLIFDQRAEARESLEAGLVAIRIEDFLLSRCIPRSTRS
jgi:heptosyltransferase III